MIIGFFLFCYETLVIHWELTQISISRGDIQYAGLAFLISILLRLMIGLDNSLSFILSK